MENNRLRKLILMSLCIVINIAGSFLALSLRLPVYLDTIGTVLSALLSGPLYGAAVGTLTGLIVSFSFDPTSLYFTPVQIVLGCLTGFLFKNKKYFSFKSVLKIFLITLVTSIISSIITTFVFFGVTSSGSVYFVSMFRLMGLNLLTSVFSVQFLSDLLDRFFSFWIAFTVIKYLPKQYSQF